MNRIHIAASILVAAATFALTQSSPAAVITALQDATPTEAEVLNNGVLVAVNLGENQSSTPPGYAAAVNVNGVNFVPLTTVLPGNAISTPISETFGGTNGQVQLVTTARGFTTFRGSDFDGNTSSDLPSPLSSLYDPIIAGNNDGTGVDITLNVSNMNIGDLYQMQLFLASSNQTNRIIDVLQGGSTLLATYDNSVVQHAEIINLSWKADQTTEQIVLRSNILGSGVPLLSGFSLTYTDVPPIPEPSSFALLGLGTLCLIRRARRRQQATR